MAIIDGMLFYRPFYKGDEVDHSFIMGVVKLDKAIEPDENSLYLTNLEHMEISTAQAHKFEDRGHDNSLCLATSQIWPVIQPIVTDKEVCGHARWFYSHLLPLGLEANWYFICAAVPFNVFDGLGRDNWFKAEGGNWTIQLPLVPSRGESFRSLNHKTFWPVEGNEYLIDTRYDWAMHNDHLIKEHILELYRQSENKETFSPEAVRQKLIDHAMANGIEKELAYELTWLHHFNDAEYLHVYDEVSRSVDLKPLRIRDRAAVLLWDEAVAVAVKAKVEPVEVYQTAAPH